MADNYSKWSEEIPIKNETERAWILNKLKERAYCGGCNEEIGIEPGAPCPTCDEETEEIELVSGEIWPGFDHQMTENSIVLYSEEGSSLDNAADFVQGFLDHFNSKDMISMHCAFTCSAMRPGEFGGAGVVVAAWGQEWRAWDDMPREREILLARRPVEQKLDEAL
jgi:hypothetical protein